MKKSFNLVNSIVNGSSSLRVRSHKGNLSNVSNVLINLCIHAVHILTDMLILAFVCSFN